ncbi:MAG: hypothetical protein GY828_04385 [Candidatus Gracilibacteria bacterium]|nr:hypothetical protein [Candidatus Gracilibacteria bacterium]
MLYYNKQAESFAGIIIGIFILSIVLIGIANIVGFSYQSFGDYATKNDILTLKKNTQNIINKLDTSVLLPSEEFYIFKNGAEGDFQVLTGSTNSGSQYINVYGERIDNIAEYEGNVYSRIAQLEYRETLEEGDYDIINFEIKHILNK